MASLNNGNLFSSLALLEQQNTVSVYQTIPFPILTAISPSRPMCGAQSSEDSHREWKHEPGHTARGQAKIKSQQDSLHIKTEETDCTGKRNFKQYVSLNSDILAI